MNIIYRYYDRHLKCDAKFELVGCTSIPTLESIKQFSRKMGYLKSIEIIFPKKFVASK